MTLETQDTGIGIAVIGMAGRFPGADNLTEFWEALCAGTETRTLLTAAELQAAGIPESLIQDPNFVNVAFNIKDPYAFDAGFFGITPRDARLMDPQQRLFLELAWQALEHAGYAADPGREKIGLYAGRAFNVHFVHALLSNQLDMGDLIQLQTLNAEFGLALWTAYKLNLTGPAVNLQAACATGLVAVHEACQALLYDDCRLALAGAVSLDLAGQWGYYSLPGGHTSPDGECRPFDAGAAGTVFGSGAGIVVLKRLEDALADGDTLYAVIKGSAAGNDGALKSGFTVPSAEGQVRTMLEALAASGVPVESISYLGVHGTGTTAGDPVEIKALEKAYRTGGRKERCPVVSTKGQFGHSDAASGMSTLLSAILALNHQQIPPTLNFKQPTPRIDWEKSSFYVNTTLRPWENVPLPRRAGVSAFGFGGANAHLIIEEAPLQTAIPSDRPCQLLVFSAQTDSALEQLGKELAAHLEKERPNLADVAYTLQKGRLAMKYRGVAVGHTVEEAHSKLLTAIEQKSYSAIRAEQAPVILLFPGQGSQYPQMGRELYESEPLFRETVDECLNILLKQAGLDLRPILYPEPGQEIAAAETLTQTQFAQPALFVIEYALARLWLAWGLQPRAVIGHSLGEYTAACIAGVFSLEEALPLVALRGKLMQAQPQGAMLSLALSREETEVLISAPVSLAAHNASNACVVSGPVEAIATLEAQCKERQIACQRLQVSHAFHSAMLEPMLEPLAEALGHITCRPPTIPIISNVSGDWFPADRIPGPAYWIDHTRRSVYFSEGLQRLLELPGAVFLEVGPGNILGKLVQRQGAAGRSAVILESLPRWQEGRSNRVVMLESLGRLWQLGLSIQWDRLHDGEKRRRIPLPTYPFERKTYKLPGDAGRILWQLLAGKQSFNQESRAEEKGLEAAAPTEKSDRVGMIAPRNEREKVLVELWQEILGIEEISIDDNFFELGGNSLLAVQLGLKAQSRGLQIDPRRLFEYPTIAALADI